MISLDVANVLVQNLCDIVDLHIDDFMQIERHRWDFGRFIFYRDPIYDIEGSSQAKWVELTSSEDWSSCIYDIDVWQPEDDMVIALFCPFKDDLSQHFQSDFQSSLGSCDADHFGDVDLFYVHCHPPSSTILDEHQDMAITKESKAHSKKRKYFHLGDFHDDSQMKRQ